MKYKAVLFDMDGTVLDTLSDLAAAVNHSLSRFGFEKVTKEHVRRSIGNGAARLMAACVPEGTDEGRLAELLEYYKKYYDEHCCIVTAPYAGIMPLMERLGEAGIRQAIISNKPQTAVTPLAKHFFGEMLEFAVGESETVRRKPDPSGILSAVEKLELKVSDCVYVGDSEVDVLTAKNAGMDCVAVSWGFRDREALEKAGAAMIADNAGELESYIL